MMPDPSRLSASFACPEDIKFKVISDRLSPSRWIILYTDVWEPHAITMTVGVAVERRVVCLRREVT